LVNELKLCLPKSYLDGELDDASGVKSNIIKIIAHVFALITIIKA